MNPESSNPAALAAAGSTALSLSPERQLALLVQDSAAFVNRGLAVLWREREQGDLSGEYFRACELLERNDLAELARLLRDQPELLEYRSPDEEGLQLLHLAAQRASVEALGLLLEHGAPLDSPNGHLQEGGSCFLPGATPLLLACEAGREEIALALLEAGADACACLPGSGETPLHLAAGQGMEMLIEALVDAGADLEAMSAWHSFDEFAGNFCGNTPLHAAALSDQAMAAYQLIKAGAQRDSASHDLRTPLHYAAARGALGVLEVLLAAGADPDALDAGESGQVAGLSPLQHAVLNAHEASAKMLLCYGADPAAGLKCLPSDGASAQLRDLLERVAGGAAVGAVHSSLDEQMISCDPANYAEMKDFLFNLLSERPSGSMSLMILSDWLAETLGAENRPHLARASREWQATNGD